MSLINQMLQDIDKRQGHMDAASAGMPLTVARRRLRPFSRVGVWAGVLVVAALAAVYGYQQWVAPVPAQVPPVVPAPVWLAPAVPATAALPQADAALAQPPVPSAIAIAPAPSSTATVGRPSDVQTPVEPEPGKPALAQEDIQAEKKAAPRTPGQVKKALSAEQRADNAYREAAALLRQGRALEAQKPLQQALTDQATHQEARLLYAQLLQGEGRVNDAKALLSEGIALQPQAYAFHAALAQMQLLSRDTDQAVSTLERGLGAAGDLADYHALLATALQQQSRHAESVQHYVVALRQQPEASNWLVGLGVSLQAQGHAQGAAQAYQRALDLGLPAALSQFARDRLQQVSR